MPTKIKHRRTNAAGLPGKYSCDRCGLPSPKGVYTGFSGFEHVCPSCKADIKAGEHSVSRIPKPKRVLSDTQKTAMRRGLAKTGPKQVIKYRKMSLPDYLASVDHALTTSELAAVLGVSRRSIFDLAKAGRIPSFRVGSSVRFDPHRVATWLRER
jgi:excisionase family DNA binding protein